MKIFIREVVILTWRSLLEEARATDGECQSGKQDLQPVSAPGNRVAQEQGPRGPGAGSLLEGREA